MSAPHTFGPECDECEGFCLEKKPVHTGSMAINLHIGQHVRHRDYKGERVTGVIRQITLDSDERLMVEIALDAPIVIPAYGEHPETKIYRQYAPVQEFTPFDDRDEIIAELLLACEGLLSSAETGVTSLGVIRSGRAAIAKAKGSTS